MKQITIGLFGFGQTGKIVANEFIKDQRFDLRWIMRRSDNDIDKPASRLLGYEFDHSVIHSISQIHDRFFEENKVDVIVDFSGSDGCRFYRRAMQMGTRLVSAISKYRPDDYEVLTSYSNETAVLYSPNITLGVNFLLVASQVLQKIAPHADIEIVEEHFRAKTEKSGTAMKIAEQLGLEKEFHVNSIRVGGIIGNHEIIFGLPNQNIRLVHESINRAAFGQGAIFASNWLVNQSPGLYSMESIISEMFRNNIPVY